MLVCSVRLVCKSCKKYFDALLGAEANKMHLSKPVPTHEFKRKFKDPQSLRGMALAERHKLLILTAASGSLENLRQAHAVIELPLTIDAYKAAASGGHRDVFKWLQHKQCPLGASVLEPAYRGGLIDLLLPLLPHDFMDFNKHSLLEVAAGAGATELCERLLADRVRPTATVLTAAAKTGNYDLCLTLMSKGALPDCGTLHAVACIGHQALYTAFLGTGLAPDLGDAYDAARQGHARVGRWLVARFCDLHATHAAQRAEYELELFAAASLSLALPALQQLWNDLQRDSRTIWNSHWANVGDLCLAASTDPSKAYGATLFTAALRSPTPDWQAKVAWLQAEGCSGPFHVDCDGLSRLPDAVVRVEFAQSRLEPVWPVGTTPGLGLCSSHSLLEAAWYAGNVPLLRYLDARLAPGVLRRHAEARGDTSLLTELVLRGVGVLTSPGAARLAVVRGQLRVLQWMAEPEAPRATRMALEADLPNPELLLDALQYGNQEMVVWLWSHCCAWDARAFPAAVKAGNPQLMKWLAACGCPTGGTAELYMTTARNRDVTTLRCLRRLGCSCSSLGDVLLKANQDPSGAGASEDKDAINWLQKQGCPIDVHIEVGQVMQQRKQYDPEGRILAWLHSEGLAPPSAPPQQPPALAGRGKGTQPAAHPSQPPAVDSQSAVARGRAAGSQVTGTVDRPRVALLAQTSVVYKWMTAAHARSAEAPPPLSASASWSAGAQARSVEPMPLAASNRITSSQARSIATPLASPATAGRLVGGKGAVSRVTGGIPSLGGQSRSAIDPRQASTAGGTPAPTSVTGTVTHQRPFR